MQLLTSHAGSWTGTNRFRLRPDDPPAEAPANGAEPAPPKRTRRKKIEADGAAPPEPRAAEAAPETANS